MAAPVEINSDDYQILELTHRMSRPGTLRFRANAELGDSPGFSTRAAVRFTVSGVCWFYGRILPGARNVGPGVETLDYTAADPSEWMGRNPCDEVNGWYNKTQDDGGVFAYPTGYTLRNIIEAELAGIIGAGKLLNSIDWTEVPSAVQSLIVYDFDTKGKTFLGILEALANEVPVLAWWIDPTACTFGSPIVGPVLRFYDVSQVPASPKVAVLRSVTDPEEAFNCEAVEINIDVSASSDTLILNGLGLLTERYEQATAEWDTWTGQFGQTLRENPSTGVVEIFASGGGGGSWTADGTSVVNRPWHPASTRSGARFVDRRYSVTYEIVDLKLQIDASTSPPTWVRVEPSMQVETLAYQWDAGPIGFLIGSTFYAGLLSHGIKSVPYTNGIVDDYGDVTPNPLVYPNYPAAPLTPRVLSGPPEAFDRNFILLPEHLVRQTSYQFISNQSGNSNYDNLCGAFVVFRYFETGAEVWVRYTGREDLTVTRTDAGLGYDKTLTLYDQRFLKYVNIDGDTLRDDTSILEDYADAMFALVSRPRITGRVIVNAAAAGAMTAWPMGAAVRIDNWNGGSYTVPARVQEIDLTQARDYHRVSVTFDTPRTFTSLDKTRQFRQFFRDNELKGQTNTPKGSRGQEFIGGGGGGSARADGSGGAGGTAQSPWGGMGTVEPNQADSPGNPAKPRQAEVTAIQLIGAGTNPGPSSTIKYQLKMPYEGAPNEQTFTAIVPENPRRDDADGAINACPTGTIVPVLWDGDVPKFFIPELDYVGPECTDAGDVILDGGGD